LIELACGGFLRRGLPVVVEREIALLLIDCSTALPALPSWVKTDCARVSVVPTSVAVLL
jgi:hypothetical protein